MRHAVSGMRHPACGMRHPACGMSESLYAACDAIFSLFAADMPPVHSVLQRQRVRLEIEQNELMIIALAYVMCKKKNKRRKHRWWVHSILKRRKEQGAYQHLVRELQEDGERFQQYFRLTREQFAQVLFLVGEDLVKHSRCREVICPRERLAICLR